MSRHQLRLRWTEQHQYPRLPVVPNLISCFIMLSGLKGKGDFGLACRTRKAMASRKRKPGGLLLN